MNEKLIKFGPVGELIRSKLLNTDGYAIIPMVRKDTEIYLYHENEGICFEKIPSKVFSFDLFDAVVSEANKLGGKMYCADSAARGGEKLGSKNLPLTVIDAFVAKNFFGKEEGDTILGCGAYIAAVLRWVGVAHYERDDNGRYIKIKVDYRAYKNDRKSLKMINIKEIINDFLVHIKDSKVEIYNEFSLQHELGIYLRNALPDYKIQFERNVSYFYDAVTTTKKEIDIVIFKEDFSEKYAIEVKFPRNGQYPEQMYQFIEDIVFLEELKELGFKGGYALTLVDNHLFYEEKITSNQIYGYFRNKQLINGEISKPTGELKSIKSLTVKGHYQIKWQKLEYEGIYYYLLEI